MGSNDPNIIAETIIQVIREQLDKRAPKKIIQISNRTTNSSDRTKEIISERNRAWKEYNLHPSMDSHRNYKHLASRVKGSLKQDKIEKDRTLVAEAADSRNQWREAKKIIVWTNYGGPKTLIKEGHPITSPKDIATELNKDYVLRTAKAARNTPPQEKTLW